MKNKLIISLIFTVISISLDQSYAIPPHCSREDLLKSSDYAVQGTVVNVECGEPYDSGECKPADTISGDFTPETISKCSAEVKVTKNIKGTFDESTLAPVPFLKVVQVCKNGSHIIPGSSTSDLTPGMNIRYYNSKLCRYSNLEILTQPTPGLEEKTE